MMRVVFDTNIIISGLLWSGAPHRALALINVGRVTALISEALVDELKEVISRPKFAVRLKLIGKTAEQIVISHLSSAVLIEANPIEPTIRDDRDDDMVLACALSGQANYIVSGDPHLLTLPHFANIPILTVNDFLKLFEQPEE